MTIAFSAISKPDAPPRALSDGIPSAAARTLLVLMISVAIAASLTPIGTPAALQAASNAGEDLTRLLRAMALLKTLLAACAVAAVLWRLGVAVRPAWLSGYAVASGAMSAGPALIWSMAFVGTGALLLHGGLLAVVIMLWCDPIVGERLAALVAARRALIGARNHRSQA